MKRLFVVFAFVMMSVISFAQHHRSVEMDDIPLAFMDGVWSIPILYAPELDEFFSFDNAPIKKATLKTYCMLAQNIVGLKVERADIESNLSLIEEQMGTDNALYGLMLAVKSTADNEDVGLLKRAEQIVSESAGTDSWEYAYILFCLSCATMDADKYGNMNLSIDYADKTLAVLENGYQDSWLYKVTLINRGTARFLNMDENALDDVVKGFNLLNNPEDERNHGPYCVIGVNVATIYAYIDMHKEALALLKDIETYYTELDCTASNAYYSLAKAVVYSSAKTKNKAQAKIYFEKAEKACLERFGKNSKEYKMLKPYRRMI